MLRLLAPPAHVPGSGHLLSDPASAPVTGDESPTLRPLSAGQPRPVICQVAAATAQLPSKRVPFKQGSETRHPVATRGQQAAGHMEAVQKALKALFSADF